MANEITITINFTALKGNFDFSVQRSQQIDMATGSGGIPGTQNVGTTHEALVVTDIATLGWAFIQNLDATNFVQIGVDVAATFYPVMRLKPGEATVVRLEPTATIYLEADTAACLVDIRVLED